jgi:antitoxin VapB
MLADADDMANKTKAKATRRLRVVANPKPETLTENPNRGIRLREYLERDVWPNLPPNELGRVLTREEEDEILGFGPDGV